MLNVPSLWNFYVPLWELYYIKYWWDCMSLNERKAFMFEEYEKVKVFACTNVLGLFMLHPVCTNASVNLLSSTTDILQNFIKCEQLIILDR